MGKKTETRRPEMPFFKKLIRDEQGATAIEYGLIAALIAVAAIVGMQALGTTLRGTFNNVSAKMQPGTTGA
jgi:pilus assembly protein Flp/PilA